MFQVPRKKTHFLKNIQKSFQCVTQKLTKKKRSLQRKKGEKKFVSLLPRGRYMENLLGAGYENRTRATSLENWGSAIKLIPLG